MGQQLDLGRIIKVDFPSTQYYEEVFSKRQIVIHHTAGGDNAGGLFDAWAQDAGRIATCVGVGANGAIYQGFSSKFWANHLGVTTAQLARAGYGDANTRNLLLNRHSIAVEICNWGPVAEHNGRWYTYAGTEVPAEKVVHYGTGFKQYPVSPFFDKIGVSNKPAVAYHAYTPEQIESVRQLVTYWAGQNKIPLTYNPDMWNVSKRALDGTAGVWTHVSFRPDKSDCHPMPELVKMLQSLAA